MSERAPRIKFCGMTNLADAQRAADLGAWAIGLIFHPASPRRCSLEHAAEIAAVLRRRLEVFGVWVNAPLDDVARTADTVKLTALQFHGDEGTAYCAEAARRTGAKVMKAQGVRSGGDLQALSAFHTDFHLLDSGGAAARGGTGTTWDWTLAAGRRRGGPPLVLSGGLSAENVGEAIAAVRPWAVDVASGVEAAPGVKDHAKLAAFVAAVQATAPAAAEAAAEPVS